MMGLKDVSWISQECLSLYKNVSRMCQGCLVAVASDVSRMAPCRGGSVDGGCNGRLEGLEGGLEGGCLMLRVGRKCLDSV